MAPLLHTHSDTHTQCITPVHAHKTHTLVPFRSSRMRKRARNIKVVDICFISQKRRVTYGALYTIITLLKKNMASFRQIFSVLALSLLTLCQVFGANTREEWIAALSRLPLLEDRYENALQNTIEEEEEVLENGGEGDGVYPAPLYFSYDNSFMEQFDDGSYQSSSSSSSLSEDRPENGTTDLRMPNVHPEKANDYFCYSVQMSPRKDVNIGKFMFCSDYF
ncbi:uncharacterized protein LOC121414758 [Lytechinus variegatus]|uniref:uncharacterized protein LOC121414758 n=1 Tax=Lytechinus variegatus TaxID=7654 RepID=UPI001BB1CE56|nr:uncharacterized protein LOC121414758 [Lytechinus variegatus]